MSGNLFKRDQIPVETVKDEIAEELQDNIINEILEIYPDIEYLKLGSVGHKELSADVKDIDIGIKCGSVEELHDIINSVFDYTQTVLMKTFYIVSIKYPYMIDKEVKYIPVDFILVKDIDYSRFRYKCPDYKNKESKYKVSTKLLLTGIILNMCDERNKDLHEGYIGQFRYLPTGLYRNVINKDNIRDYVEEFVSLNVDEIISIMFGDKGSRQDFDTVETIWEAIHSDRFKYKDRVKDIEMMFFIHSYRKCWEELIKPEDFKLEYWSVEDINKELEKHRYLRNLNNALNNLKEA